MTGPVIGDLRPDPEAASADAAPGGREAADDPAIDREPQRLGARRRRPEEAEETPRWLYLLWAAGGVLVIAVALVMLAPDATGAFLGDVLRDLPGAPARVIELVGSVLHVLTGGR